MVKLFHPINPSLLAIMAHVTILDYGAGNVRSIKNAIKVAGYETRDVESVEDIHNASILVFPGVGTFKQAMDFLIRSNYLTALRDYIQANRPYLGICLGMQTLFEASEECDEHKVRPLALTVLIKVEIFLMLCFQRVLGSLKELWVNLEMIN